MLPNKCGYSPFFRMETYTNAPVSQVNILPRFQCLPAVLLFQNPLSLLNHSFHLIFFSYYLIEFSSTRFDSFIICIRCTCLMCLIIFRRNVLVGFVNRINVSVKYWHINSYSSPNSNNRVGFCSNLHKSVSAPISIGTSFLYSL